MPTLKTYDLFISHPWSHNEEYERIVSLLKEAPNFYFRNYSAPENNPLKNPNGTPVTNKTQIKAAIDNKIRPVNCVLIMSGMYVNYHEWLEYELIKAVTFDKPIVAIRPWGQQNIPISVSIYADTIVGWNTSSIVNAIRQYSI